MNEEELREILREIIKEEVGTWNKSPIKEINLHLHVDNTQDGYKLLNNIKSMENWFLESRILEKLTSIDFTQFSQTQ